MNFTDLLIMRQELMLVLLTVLVVFIDLMIEEKRKDVIIWFALVLFGIITLVGFIPSLEGSLFGGMYNSSGLLVAMKNILNLAMLIVLLQSVKWMRSGVNKGKTSEYFMLLFSTLIGIDFMISAGDFLMFYIGLELATIPATALAAFDRSRNSSAEAGIKFLFSSALSSGILLMGLSIIYGTTGSIYFTDVAAAFGSSPLQVL